MNTIERAFLEYLDEKRYKNHTVKTLTNDHYLMQHYIKHPLEKWRKVFFDRAKKQKAISTDRDLGRLKTFCKWLRKHKYIKKSPFDGIDPPKVEFVLPKTLSPDQVRSLLKHAGYAGIKMKTIIWTFLYTGLRKSELLNLTERDVHLVERYIEVQRGKGNKGRIVPINSELFPILQEWHVKRDTSDVRYFCTSGESIKRYKKKIEKNVRFQFTFHQLRHTFATKMSQLADLTTLSKILGHAKVTTTASIYVSVSLNRMIEESNKVRFGY